MSPRRAAARGGPEGGVRPQGARPPVVGALLIVAAALASACAFHLQGRVPLPDPVKTPYLEAPDWQSEFVQSLRRALLSNEFALPVVREGPGLRRGQHRAG